MSPITEREVRDVKHATPPGAESSGAGKPTAVGAAGYIASD